MECAFLYRPMFFHCANKWWWWKTRRSKRQPQKKNNGPVFQHSYRGSHNWDSWAYCLCMCASELANPPPAYTSVISRVKSAREESATNDEFVKRLHSIIVDETYGGAGMLPTSHCRLSLLYTSAEGCCFHFGLLVRERSALATLIFTLRVCLSVIRSVILSVCPQLRS